MNRQINFNIPDISWVEIDAAIAQARFDRAEGMRQALAAFSGWCKRVALRWYPNRARPPRTRAWASRQPMA